MHSVSCFLVYAFFFLFLPFWELVGSSLEVPRPLNFLDDMLWCRSSITPCAVFLVGNFSLENVVLGIFLKLFCRWFHPLYFYSSFLQGFLLLSCWVSCGCPLIFYLLFPFFSLSFCSIFWDIYLNLPSKVFIVFLISAVLFLMLNSCFCFP